METAAQPGEEGAFIKHTSLPTTHYSFGRTGVCLNATNSACLPDGFTTNLPHGWNGPTLPWVNIIVTSTKPNNPLKPRVFLFFPLSFFTSVVLINISFSKPLYLSSNSHTLNFDHESWINLSWLNCWDYSFTDSGTCMRSSLKVRGRLQAESHYTQESNYYGSAGRSLRPRGHHSVSWSRNSLVSIRPICTSWTLCWFPEKEQRCVAPPKLY